MRILSLETIGVRGLADATHSFEPDRGTPGHAIVVTGPPRVGLTSFLDAIAMTASLLAVGGLAPSVEDALRAGGAGAAIRTSWWLEADERVFAGVQDESVEAEVLFRRGELARAEADPGLLGLMSRYDHSPELSKVVSIPARRVTDGALPPFLDFEMDQKLKHLSSAADKFAGISGALARHAAGFGERARFETVQRVFGELTGSAQLAGVDSSGRLEFTLSSGGRALLSTLSLGERNALVLAAVPVLLGLQRSVILLDTPELGLPPGEAARWLDILRDHTPGAQWIVASRDPAVVAKVEASARIELKRLGS